MSLIRISREGWNLPSLLQQGVDLLASRLCNLLRASFALAYIPQTQREVKVVFIPKARREYQTQTKTHWPVVIPLETSIEVDKYIKRDEVLRTNPLNRHEYACEPGKSC